MNRDAQLKTFPTNLGWKYLLMLFWFDVYPGTNLTAGCKTKRRTKSLKQLTREVDVALSTWTPNSAQYSISAIKNILKK